MTTPTSSQKTYQLYGRKSYSEPLHFVDKIQIEHYEDINAIVFARVEKTDWLELVAFPSKAAIQVLPREGGP